MFEANITLKDFDSLHNLYSDLEDKTYLELEKYTYGELTSGVLVIPLVIPITFSKSEYVVEV